VHFSRNLFRKTASLVPGCSRIRRQAHDFGSFKLIAESRPATSPVGGDFYAFEPRDSNRLTMVIGDACGHGEQAAVLLPCVLAILEELSPATTRPSRLLEELNRCVVGDMPSDRFVTAAAFEFDAAAGILTVANAGHVPAIVRDARGRVSVIGRPSGPPLGVFHQASYKDQRYRIGKNDVIVFMTDGIVEAVETDLAKMPRLTSALAEAPAGHEGVLRSLLANVDRFAPERFEDDMTLVSLEVVGPCARVSVGASAVG
jgi:serine phosphatase RsbU (regulator of sigma subunit)